MALRPEASIGTGLAVSAIVYSIHSNFTPSIADMQGLPAGNADVDGAERKATWLSAGVVAGVSLLAKDPTIFVMGSIATVALAFFSRHATWTDTKAGPAVASPGQSVPTSANDTAVGPSMSTADYSMFAGSSQFVSS